MKADFFAAAKGLRPLLVVLSLGLCLSCTEIFEPSIERAVLVVNAPYPGATSTNYNQTFWWEEVEGALSYQLQIASPGFDSVRLLRLDTALTENKITVSLAPGAYEWRLRALNGSSRTPFVTYRLQIDTSALSEQSVELLQPGDDALLKASQGFRWEPLFGTKLYRFQIDTAAFADETQILFEKTTASPSYNFSFPVEGTYQWRVRAENGATYSEWSPVYTLTYDKTPPATVTPTAPANNATDVSTPVTLQWESASARDQYKVLIYRNSETNLIGTYASTTNRYTYSGSRGEVIYWQVRAVDPAGNESSLSPKWKFTIAP